MKTTKININLIDHYYSILKSLSPNNKLELIARLINSMESQKNPRDDSWKSLFGSLKLDQTADQFIENLQQDRNFNREPIDL